MLWNYSHVCLKAKSLKKDSTFGGTCPYVSAEGEHGTLGMMVLPLFETGFPPKDFMSVFSFQLGKKCPFEKSENQFVCSKKINFDCNGLYLRTKTGLVAL